MCGGSDTGDVVFSDTGDVVFSDTGDVVFSDKICGVSRTGDVVANTQDVPLTSALLYLPKGKSLGGSKPATNS